MKLTPVAKKNNKAKKQGFLSRSTNILKSRRQKGRKNLIKSIFLPYFNSIYQLLKFELL